MSSKQNKIKYETKDKSEPQHIYISNEEEVVISKCLFSSVNVWYLPIGQACCFIGIAVYFKSEKLIEM